jgi:hypothetical protein
MQRISTQFCKTLVRIRVLNSVSIVLLLIFGVAVSHRLYFVASGVRESVAEFVVGQLQLRDSSVNFNLGRLRAY